MSENEDIDDDGSEEVDREEAVKDGEEEVAEGLKEDDD